MYEEFIIGYVLSGLAVLLLTVVIILQCIILKRTARGGMRSYDASSVSYGNGGGYSSARKIAICRNCATQFDSAHTVCPKCGTPR